MKLILHYLGYILILSAIFRVVPIIASFVFSEPSGGFFISAILSWLIGFICLKLSKKSKSRVDVLSFRNALLLVAISALVLSLIGSIAYLKSMNYVFINAFFESVSGFTTTGLSAYESIDELPKSLLLWRAMTQWLGALGVVLFFLFMSTMKSESSDKSLAELEHSSQAQATLYHASGFSKPIQPGVKSSVQSAIGIYIIYTILGVFLLFLTGLSFFESVSMSFTSLSTGGFSVTDNFEYNSIQQVILSFLMLLGSTSFLAHNSLFRKKFKAFFLDPERTILLFMMIVGGILSLSVFPNIGSVAFNIISAFSSTGYATVNFGSIPPLFFLVICLGMLVGGSTVSTAGGLKVFRFYVILKSVLWHLKKLFSPLNAVIPFKVFKKPIEPASILTIYVFFGAFISILSFGTIVLILLGLSLDDAVFQMISALSTIGLSSIKISGLHWIGKLVLIIAMFLGRLEIFPILLLFKYLFAGKS